MVLNEAPLGAAGISPGREPGVAEAPLGAAEVIITPEVFFCPDGAMPQKKTKSWLTLGASGLSRLRRFCWLQL
jgi:hypothetical protein